jgi:hypothetical protein
VSHLNSSLSASFSVFAGRLCCLAREIVRAIESSDAVALSKSEASGTIVARLSEPWIIGANGAERIPLSTPRSDDDMRLWCFAKQICQLFALSGNAFQVGADLRWGPVKNRHGGEVSASRFNGAKDVEQIGA